MQPGSRVMPVLELYAGLKTYEERKAFQDALEQMLTDPCERVRKFAVDVCLGFFGFRDAIFIVPFRWPRHLVNVWQA